MSFDLYFYKKKNSPLTEQSFSDYLNKSIPYNNSDYSRQWDYRNPETGADFLINWNEPNTEPEDIAIWDSFAEFEYLNFDFQINFFRPRYFGIEVFPIIEKIIEKFDLYILNQQDENDPENPQKFPKGYLQEQWIRHNDQLSATYFEELKFNYMPLEKSNAMWWFQLHRNELQESLTEDIFVAGIIVLKGKDDGKLYTICVWPEHIPVILPVVDYVVINKKYKLLFKIIEESGMVPYHLILQELGNYFDDFDYTVADLKVLRPANAIKIKNKFNNLKIFKTVEEFGTGVAMGGFVNVRT